MCVTALSICHVVSLFSGPSVCWSVRLTVHLSVRLSVAAAGLPFQPPPRLPPVMSVCPVVDLCSGRPARPSVRRSVRNRRRLTFQSPPRLQLVLSVCPVVGLCGGRSARRSTRPSVRLPVRSRRRLAFQSPPRLPPARRPSAARRPA